MRLASNSQVRKGLGFNLMAVLIEDIANPCGFLDLNDNAMSREQRGDCEGLVQMIPGRRLKPAETIIVAPVGPNVRRTGQLATEAISANARAAMHERNNAAHDAAIVRISYDIRVSSCQNLR
jgi:hypothetical protein